MQKIARRYAAALFKLTSKAKDQEQHLKDLLTVQQWISESPEFANLLSNPLIPRDQAAAVMAALSKKAKLHKSVTNLLAVLCDEGRLSLLSQVIEAYQHFYNDAHNILLAEVESAQPVTKDLEKKFDKALADHFDTKLVLKHKVNPDLLGGFRAKVGSHLIDASIKTQIMKLSRMLKGA